MMSMRSPQHAASLHAAAGARASDQPPPLADDIPEDRIKIKAVGALKVLPTSAFFVPPYFLKRVIGQTD
jgi:hypothetical protein